MDLAFLAPIVDAFKAHAYGTCALAIVLAVLNVAFRLKTPAQWVAVLDGYPRVHALMDVVRAFIQPVELVNALYRAATGRWPSDTSGGAKTISMNDVGRRGVVDRSDGVNFRTLLHAPFLLPIALLFAICVVLSSLSGCGGALGSWWGGGGEQTVLTLAERVAADALKGMSVDAIAKDLGVAVVDVIRELLTSKDASVGATPAHAEATARVGELRDAGAR